MVRKLNKLCFLLLLIWQGAFIHAQVIRLGDKDYKDEEQFEKFSKRRKMVAAWQISQLKEGALVVRLRTNHLLEEALIKKGKVRLAEEKRLETQAINMNTMRAYINHYTFSKVYFIYSNSSDTLLKGARGHIFIDTTLNVNPAIVMTEKFYLLAERDDAYNSSIGFLTEDSAKVQIEKGTAVKEMAVIIKNKYGQQLKKPFPYDISDVSSPRLKSFYVEYVNIQGVSIPFNVSISRKTGSDGPEKGSKSYNYKGALTTLYIPKYLTYMRLSLVVDNLNNRLYEYYKYSPRIDMNRLDPSIRPFLY